MLRVRCIVLLAVALLAVLASGCGRGKVRVKGQVLRDGKPLAVGPTGSILVTLIPEASSEKGVTNIPTYADNSTGEFEAMDVPMGKYRIAVEHNDPTPQDDKLEGAFNPTNTKIVRDINGKTPINIDLSKPEG